MTLSRRTFIQQSLKTIVVIGAGNVLQSFAANDFTLPSKKKVILRFAIASDGHYGQAGTAYDEHHDEMIRWLNAEQQGRGLDFTMINGDLYHDNADFLITVKNKFDKLQMPFRVSHGNHDITTETHWAEVWNSPWHYTFEEDDTGFLVLNSADEKGKYICPDLEWTRDALKKYQTKKQLFVFMHITPFNWTKNGLPCPELVTMFNQQPNLKAVFHGHDHDMDDVKEAGGKFYFFDSHIAGNWGTEYRGYRIVEILKHGNMVTYQMNPATMQQVNSNKL